MGLIDRHSDSIQTEFTIWDEGANYRVPLTKQYDISKFCGLSPIILD